MRPTSPARTREDLPTPEAPTTITPLGSESPSSVLAGHAAARPASITVSDSRAMRASRPNNIGASAGPKGVNPRYGESGRARLLPPRRDNRVTAAHHSRVSWSVTPHASSTRMNISRLAPVGTC